MRAPQDCCRSIFPGIPPQQFLTTLPALELQPVPPASSTVGWGGRCSIWTTYTGCPLRQGVTKPLPKTTQISKLCLKTAASVLGEFHTGEDREVPRPGLRPSRVFPQLQWLHAEGDGTAFSLPCEVCMEPALWAVGWGHWVGRQEIPRGFQVAQCEGPVFTVSPGPQYRRRKSSFEFPCVSEKTKHSR